MRKIAGIAIVFTGSIFCIFIFNLVLYSMNPHYRSALENMVDDNNIPVVAASTDPVVLIPEEKDIVNSEDSKDTSYIAYTSKTDDKDDTAKPQEEEKVIIDKTYHEDCGTGQGSWVITYSDGSVGLE